MMPLNVRLQLESLDGRWLPSTTTVEPPDTTVTVETQPFDPSVFYTQAYLDQLALVKKTLGELHDVCREYAKRQAGVEINERELADMQAELDRRVAANEDQGTLPQDIAILRVTLGTLKVLAMTEATNYAAKLADLQDQLTALNNMAPGAKITVRIPDLDHYLAVELIKQENPPTPIPPGVG
jgi:hypothetical protein